MCIGSISNCTPTFTQITGGYPGREAAYRPGVRGSVRVLPVYERGGKAAYTYTRGYVRGRRHRR